jgi:hypothetical protein
LAERRREVEWCNHIVRFDENALSPEEIIEGTDDLSLVIDIVGIGR